MLKSSTPKTFSRRCFITACIVISVILLLSSTTGAEYRRVCYFKSQSQYGSPRFVPADIDPTLCSHVLFAFASIYDNQLTITDRNDEARYQQVNRLKSINFGLKSLLTAGGNSAGQTWSSMLSTSDNRQQFISSSISYLRSRNFDGLDLAFLYPGTGTSPPGDKQLFTTLIQGLRAAFNEEGVATGRVPLLLSAAVSAGEWLIDSAYDVPGISQATDFISILSYDYHGSWEKVTGHNSPLFPLSTDSGATLNVRSSAEYWVSLGAPRNKLVIGIPFFSRCFTLSTNATGFGAPISGACFDGEVKKYNQICALLGRNETTRYWSADQQVPYLICNGNQWIGYDDAQSVAVKAKWSQSNGYGGWMIWSLDQDDFTGSACVGHKYPLLKALNSATTPSTTTSARDLWIPICITIIVTVVIVLTTTFIVHRRCKGAHQEQLNDEYGLEDDGSCKLGAKPNMSYLRICRESELRRGDVIGTGAFGTVFKGYFVPEHERLKIPVAIKEISEISNSNLSTALLDEAQVMASVRHHCCVQIVALCLTKRPLIVVPLLPLGSLLDYLRRNKSNIGSRALLLWSQQIATGMEYLETIGIVHRDLAARNVLVQSAAQVKITDFGLAKLLDHNKEGFQSSGGKLPIKWLALESIKTGVFNHKTDVWSYGVTLWEMFTFGLQPFKDVKIVDMATTLEEGKRLPQPSICTIDVYMFMIKCWLIDPENRPTFAKLSHDVSEMSSQPTRYLNIRNDASKQLDTVEPDLKDLVRGINVTLEDDDLDDIVYADKYYDMERRSDARQMRTSVSNDYVPCVPNDKDSRRQVMTMGLDLASELRKHDDNDYVNEFNDKQHQSATSQMTASTPEYLELVQPSDVDL